MKSTELISQRFHNQHLSGAPLASPKQAVAWLGAVQSQDYHGAKWALAQRLDGATNASLDDAFNRGDVLRTHILRPTWHFVTPEDIRWMLQLTAPRVHRSMSGFFRQAGLDAPALTRHMNVIANGLEGGNALTRTDIFKEFERAGIPAFGQTGGNILMYAELEGLIANGPLRGRQHTYMLLDERAPAPTSTFDRDQALATIAIRYFQSHGPGTPRDLSWWSSLTLTDCRRAVDVASADLDSVDIDGTTWWAGEFPAGNPDIERPHVRLLPNYDEYFSRDGRVERYHGPPTPKLQAFLADDGRFSGHHIVIDGLLRGTWLRQVNPRAIRVTIDPFDTYTHGERAAVEAQAAHHARFMDLTLNLAWT